MEAWGVRRRLFFGAVALYCLSLFSCAGLLRPEDGSGGTDLFRQGQSPVLLVERDPRPVQPVTAPSAILVRGDTRASGLPGFGPNAFSSVYGEYNVEFPAEGEAGAASDVPGFFVWASGEPVYYDPGIWTLRPSPGGYQMREQNTEDGQLFALSLESGPPGEYWTLIVGFPSISGNEPLSGGSRERLISSLVSRFTYFVSIKHYSSDVSLPAVITF
ncbi:hypothetical protein [Breznakiella homolactica]|uniref:Uncharacterized protein n=1 Tax=Breznakiella homolactica TaxID=2798577 RepID=A0A7T7XNL8_9SPIR|nr:hypothetical protein [Breznakiella homolactica]QQO09547.1 hypothetical protein JFL75_01090 [Breznakiella homolactica]